MIDVLSSQGIEDEPAGIPSVPMVVAYEGCARSFTATQWARIIEAWEKGGRQLLDESDLQRIIEADQGDDRDA